MRNSLLMTLVAVFITVAMPFAFGQDKESVVKEKSAKREPFQLFDNLFFCWNKGGGSLGSPD